MGLNFTGKRAVVTGGSRGIGKAIAEVILKGGGDVLITSTSVAPAWLNDYPAASHRQVDFLDKESVSRYIEQIFALENVDILVNNAGVYGPRAIDKIDDEVWNRVLEVNLSAPMYMMRAVASKMKTQRRGWILNVSSISGIIARQGGSAYAASKAGLIGLTRAVALDLAPDNILVNALCPGTTETDMVDRGLNVEEKEKRKSESALKRFAKPEEIANVVAFLCSDLNTYITGQTIVVDGGTVIQ